MGLNAKLERITPEVAAEWMKCNRRNRHLRKTQVQLLSEAIRRGEWVVNGDPIRFAEDGTLLDGQHRLQAVINTGIAVESMVIRGLPNQTQRTMDTGRRRTLADALHLEDESNPTNLAAALNLVHCWSLGESALRSRTGYRLSPDQALSLLEEHPEVREAVTSATRIRSRLNNTVPNSILAACWYRFSRLSEENCTDFFTRLADGENLHRGDPVYALRSALYQNARRATKVRPLMLHAWVVKAWNAFREGREVETISWRAGIGESFPEPV